VIVSEKSYNYTDQRRESTTDIGPILDEGRWARFGMWVTFLASLAFLVDGLALQVVSLSIPAIMRDWHVPRAAFANVVAIGYLGISIGTVCAGMLADRFGRRTMLLVSILVFDLATAAISQVNGIPELIGLRFIDGLGLGGSIPIATSLIAEFTPTSLRSRAVNLGMVSISIGGVSAGLLGARILPGIGWRMLFLAIAVVTFAVLVLLLVCLPESPRYLVRNSASHARLRRILNKLNVIADPASQLVDTRRRTTGRNAFAEVFGRGAMFNTMLLWGAFFFCLMMTYIIVSWIPTVLAARGYDLTVTSSTSSLYGCGGIVGSLLCARFVETLGSRIMMSILAGFGAVIAASLSILPLGPQYNQIPMLGAILGLGLCIGGLTGCLYALAAHTYPPAVRASGIGAASGVGRIGGIVSPYVAALVLGLGGRTAFFQCVGVCSLCLLAFLLLVRSHIPARGA